MYYLKLFPVLFILFVFPTFIQAQDNNYFDFKEAEPFYLTFPGEPQVITDEDNNLISIFYVDGESGKVFALAFPMDPGKEQVPLKKEPAINILLTQVKEDLESEEVDVENIRIISIEDRAAVGMYEYEDKEMGKGMGKIVVTDKTFFSIMTIADEEEMIQFLESFRLAD